MKSPATERAVHRFCAVLLAATLSWSGSAAGESMAAPPGPPLLRAALRPQVQVDQARVSLGEVADLSSPDLALLRRAMALPLGWAPRVGESTVLEADGLQRWLHVRLGLSSGSVQWSGVSAAEIRSTGRTVDGEDVVAVASRALQAHLNAIAARGGWQTTRIAVQPVQVPASFGVPGGPSQLVPRPLVGSALSSRMLVWVDVLAGERTLRSVPVRFEVEAFAHAVVATERLSVGQAVKATNVERREIDLSRSGMPMRGRGATSANVTEAEPVQIRKSARAGEVLTADHVEAPPSVVRSQEAVLTSRQGLVELESRVEVLQDGRVGQLVRVRQAGANGHVLARVTGPGRLEMQP